MASAEEKIAEKAPPADLTYDVEKLKPGSADGVELLEEPPLSVGVGKGNWLHIGYHMCTSVCGPALLGLPFAVALLGWPAGIVVMCMGYFTTLWTTSIIADLCEWDGKRHIRYRDLAESIFGRFWGKAIIWPCQWTNLIGAAISILIQAGLSMQGIYQLHSPGATDLKLWQFIIIMGALALVTSQLPTTHSLRYQNLVSMLVTYSFSGMAIVISIYQGHKYNTPKDYGVHSSSVDKAFGALNGIVIISFAYGNTIVPEIAATAKPPLKSTMRGGIGVLYLLLAVTYFPVSISGYWAYGYALVENSASFLPSYFGSVGGPKWLIYICLGTTLGNAVMGICLYSSSVNEFVESKVYKRSDGLWGVRNWLIRTVWRSSFICLITFIAALIPFFGDFLALIGAVGITPIDFVYPFVLALKVGIIKSRAGRALAIFLMSLYTLVGVGGAIAALRGIILDAKNYSAFANLGVSESR